jgi:hypothetical protein
MRPGESCYGAGARRLYGVGVASFQCACTPAWSPYPARRTPHAFVRCAAASAFRKCEAVASLACLQCAQTVHFWCGVAGPLVRTTVTFRVGGDEAAEEYKVLSLGLTFNELKGEAVVRVPAWAPRVCGVGGGGGAGVRKHTEAPAIPW